VTKVTRVPRVLKVIAPLALRGISPKGELILWHLKNFTSKWSINPLHGERGAKLQAFQTSQSLQALRALFIY
jgi:hypothetical protein